MLVLSRKLGERIHVGDGITITIVAVQGQRVRVGIEAPASVAIRREELDGQPAGPARADPDARNVCRRLPR